MAWVKPWGKGKVFYTMLGHMTDVCRNPFFRSLFIGGAKWALSRRKCPAYDPADFAIA